MYYTIAGIAPNSRVIITDTLDGPAVFSGLDIVLSGDVSEVSSSYTSNSFTFELIPTIPADVPFALSFVAYINPGADTQICNEAELEVGGSFIELSDNVNTGTPDAPVCVAPE